MINKLLKFSLVCVTGAIVLTTNQKTAMAYEEPVAGYTYDKISYDAQDNGSTITSFALYDIPIPGFKNIGIANVTTNLLIRSGRGEDYKIIGKLPKNGGCEILESNKNGWTKITSGKVTGYVNSQYLITGVEATRLAKEVGSYVATANTNGLRVRREASTGSEVLDQIAKGEELLVLDSRVITDDKAHGKWVQVRLDSDEEEDGTIAYVAKEYVNLSFELIKAVSIEELQYGSGVSSTRVNLVNFAKKYLGESYVWGGTTLGGGVDCSGFTMRVYEHFGYSIPRTSRSQGSSGTRVSASSLKPGDLVFYGSSSYINHVAIYIGNNRVIHASNRRDGIKISNMYYRQPVKYVRYIND